jgi:multisubunit Na+/H+ antiporter MnhF subunit
MTLLSINHVVAFLGLVLALSVYLVMKRFSVPDKLAVGAAILSALVVSIFWTSVMLGTDEDEE